MMAGRASLSSSSSFSYAWTYDVFLSFRGKDTRHGFTGNLFNAFKERGIHTFFDDQELQGGEEITPTLVKAIEESRIAIPVFSKNYATSSFCLDELVKIMEFVKAKGRLVLPVFYGVDPSDVRHQRGSYGEAMAKHEKRFKDHIVQAWKEALMQAANLSGKHFMYGNNEYEHGFIKEIVEVVSNKINRVPLHVAEYPVGLMSLVLEVCEFFNVGLRVDDRVHMLGIHGIGGIGKTTLARAIFNSIADQFDGLCFLENVRENSIRYGLEYLQEMLLSELLGEKDIKLGSINKGITIIKHRLKRKKVLLILDDVDKRKQLQALVGGLDWFDSGSIIIITSRDKHLLTCHGVEKPYELHGLNEDDARKLFEWNSFKNEVDPSFTDIINRALTYAACLPLALEVIGSNLWGKDIEEWESTLDRYERIPAEDIQEVLKISFDDLAKDAQSVFLDIACCFKGFYVSTVEDILFAHYDSCSKHAIGVLVDRSLIKIDPCSHQVTLHDLIQHMGREIVRQEGKPGERSRLWFPRDILQVLEENEGTSKIEMIFLDLYNSEKKVVEWDGEAFKDMTSLKTLIIRNACFSQSPEHLPNSLRVLEWQNYQSHSLPADFCPKKLVILDLPNSYLTSFNFMEMQRGFKSMRALFFDRAKYVTKIPNLSRVPNLEKLSFSNCENLIEIHESVGSLGKLKILDAQSCSKLRSFPPLKLTSLEGLYLSSCSSLESFPEILCKMENITKLTIEHTTAMKEMPPSIRNLTGLQYLHMNECGIRRLSSGIAHMPELKEVLFYGSSNQNEDEGKASSIVSSNKSFHVSKCNMSDEIFPLVLDWFANVENLNMLHHNFTVLPTCITECLFLRKLDLDECYQLGEIRVIPPNLESLCATRCRSLESVDFTVLSAGTKEYHFFRTLILDKCESLREIRGIPPNLYTLFATRCRSLEVLDLAILPAGTKKCRLLRRLALDHCENLQEIKGVIPPNIEFSALNCTSLTYSCRSMLLNQELHEKGGAMWFIYPESGVPEWFQHRSSGSSISFWFRNMFPAISLCVAFEGLSRSHNPFHFCPKLHINGNTVDKWLVTNKGCWSMPSMEASHVFVFDDKRTKFEDHVMNEALVKNDWNHAEVFIDAFSIYQRILLGVQIGLHVFQEKGSMEDVRFTEPYERDNNNAKGDDSNSMVSTQTSSTSGTVEVRTIEFDPRRVTIGVGRATSYMGSPKLK